MILRTVILFLLFIAVLGFVSGPRFRRFIRKLLGHDRKR